MEILACVVLFRTFSNQYHYTHTHTHTGLRRDASDDLCKDFRIKIMILILIEAHP